MLSFRWRMPESFLSMVTVRKQMPELDTLRGIAVLMVVFFHGFGFLVGPYNLGLFVGLAKYFVAATWLGWMGVNLFFVLSGFLITGILLESKRRPDYFRRFYFRRALRILPAYYLLLLLLPVIGLLPHFPRHVGWPFVTMSFFYLANMVEFFGIHMQYGPLWSLAVEEHFYLLWPAVVKAVVEKALAWVAVGIIIASPALRVFTPGTGVTWHNLDGLAMGAILAIVARTASRRTLTLASIACVGGSVIGAFCGVPFGVHKSSTWVGAAFKTTLVDVFFLGLVIAFLLVGTSKFASLVNIRWLKFYGFISYGLYLVHMLAYDAYDAWQGPVQMNIRAMTVRFVVALAASTLFCWVMRVTYEEFFLRMKDRSPQPAREEPAESAARA